jgi:hypothetical protein
MKKRRLSHYFKKLFLILTFCGFSYSHSALAQCSAVQTPNVNNSIFDRIIGQTVAEIFPKPPGVNEAKYQIQCNKTVTKLRGEANEALLTSLMALGFTYAFAPTSAPDLDEIVSKSTTFLRVEEGAYDSNILLEGGLLALEDQLKATSNDIDSIQIETLIKQKESLKFIKDAILVKLRRYQTYSINDLSSAVINAETNNLNRCENGSPPKQNGLQNILGFLTTTWNNNDNTITNLTATINTDLTAYPLVTNTTIAQIDTLINDPLTTPLQLLTLDTIKTNMETKAQLILDNQEINTCSTQMTPKVLETGVIKREEDAYIVSTMNSILDPGASIQIPAIPTNYTNFDLSTVCLSIPPSVATEVNTVKTNCAEWINHYKTLYAIPQVTVDSVAAIGNQSYLKISNCGREGRNCDPAPMNRLGSEMQALAVFPIGRLAVSEMLTQSLQLAILFYSDLLNSPQLYDCDQIVNPNEMAQDIARRDCNKLQIDGGACNNTSNIGLDCDRAQISYQLYKLKIDSQADDEIADTTTRGAGEGQSGEEGEGAGEIAFNGANGPNGATGPNKTTVSGDKGPITFSKKSSSLGNSGQLNKNAGLANTSGQKKKSTNFAKNTAFNNLTLSKLGAEMSGRGSFRVVNKFFKEKFKLDKKLKPIFSGKSKDSIANSITQNFSAASIEKFSKSFNASENLFASAIPTNGVKEKNVRGSKTVQAATTSYNPTQFNTNYRFRPGSSNITRRKKAKDGPTLNEDSIEIEIFPGSNSYRAKRNLSKIHSNKIGLFEIISRRFRRTDIYFENTY